MNVRYAERRRTPLIKRLSAAAVLILVLALLADMHTLIRQNVHLLQRVEDLQQKAVTEGRTTEQGVDQLRADIAAGKPVTAEELDRIFGERLIPGPQGPQGKQGPEGRPGPAGPPGPPGSIPATTSTTRRPVATTTTTRCVVRIGRACT